MLSRIRAERWHKGRRLSAGEVLAVRALQAEETTTIRQMLATFNCDQWYQDNSEAGVYRFGSMPMHIDCVHKKNECTLMLLVKGKGYLAGYQHKGRKLKDVGAYFEIDLDHRRTSTWGCRVIAFNDHLPHSFISYSPDCVGILTTVRQEFLDFNPDLAGVPPTK